MALVDYSDSDSEDGEEEKDPPAKKLRLSDSETSALPPLPAAFRDLYSSTVRTSTQDDPTLHSGRKRVTPHIVGNWPTHVYLEWSPDKSTQQLLCDVVGEVKISHAASNDKGKYDVHSLLENDLGVQLPLHISLSRPLALQTSQKDLFPAQLRSTISQIGVRAFSVKPVDIIWHANEDRTRWFLVLRLCRPKGDELRKLLNGCNDLAGRFDQPLLYEAKQESHEGDENAHDSFHISIAWSLHPPGADEHKDAGRLKLDLRDETLDALRKLEITFDEVKVRVGQDVSSYALRKPRVAKDP